METLSNKQGSDGRSSERSNMLGNLAQRLQGGSRVPWFWQEWQVRPISNSIPGLCRFSWLEFRFGKVANEYLTVTWRRNLLLGTAQATDGRAAGSHGH